ncbi:hypothetical protein R1flu_027607 [Riccia fluitans]|uniref:HAT C-terminal dimerisation domain-containing protein n=1 Tax=Riccia fluitans TaxID=41844 RepID=A0ABD1XJC0_9MARC
MLKRYQKVCWLSRYQALSALCDSLESMLSALQDNANDNGEEAKNIKLCYLKEKVDVNAFFLNDDIGFHAILAFGPPRGYLKALGTRMRGSKFLSIDIERSRLAFDLEEAIVFQKHFTQACIDALKEKFVDNDVVGAFHILSPSNMPSKMVKLRDWGQMPMEILCEHFGVAKPLFGVLQDPLLSSILLRTEFFNFKSHAIIAYNDLSFRQLWQLVDLSDSLKLKYPELSKLSTIARVQCCSTAECERGFSLQNIIKSKIRNRVTIEHLDWLLKICMEGSDLKEEQMDVKDILTNAIDLWKNFTHHHFLGKISFKNLKRVAKELGENMTDEEL